MVIAVIAILAALLLPVLSRAKHKAWTVACQSNQRQLTLKFLMRVQDGGTRLDTQAVGEWYGDDFASPTNQKSPSLCPEAPLNPALGIPVGRGLFGTVSSAWMESGWVPIPYMPSRETRTSSYGCNDWLIGAGFHVAYPLGFAGTELFNWPSPGEFLSEDQVVHSAETPLLADCVWSDVAPNPTDLPARDLVYGADPNAPAAWGPQPGFWKMCSLTIPRHGNRPNPVPTNWPAGQKLPGAINVALFDGHVELVKLYRLWQLYWSADWVPP